MHRKYENGAAGVKVVIFGPKSLGRQKSTIFPIRRRQWHLKPFPPPSNMSFGPSWGGECFLLQNFVIVGWTDLATFFFTHVPMPRESPSHLQVVNILSFTEYDSPGKIPPIVTLGLQCLPGRRRSDRFLHDNTHESHGSPSYDSNNII